jgi:prepilin-type N-terminal cleavage/methylation domain-containing protein/prepilin-type processing-associated H-X9-DG protein
MSNIGSMRRAFTLIELLVVIAIIAILAAILFPVFAQAKAAAKKTACLAQQRQVGIALQQYMTDCDDTVFFFAHAVDTSRTQPLVPFGATRENRWWNQIQPYAKNLDILASPSDPGQKPHPLEDGLSGRPLVKRSYVANRALEGLNASLIERPSDIVIVTIKNGIYDDSWFEPPKNLYDKAPGTPPVLALDLQGGGVNLTFADGHAKWQSKGKLLSDPCGLPYSGVDIMRLYPIPPSPGNPTRTMWHPNCPN